MKKLISSACVAFAALLSVSQGHATSASAVLDIEGHPSCNSLAVDDILEARDNRPRPGKNSTRGPDRQKFAFKVSRSKKVVTAWEIKSPGKNGLLPVNFVILKWQSVRRHHDGADSDSDSDSGADSDSDSDSRRGHSRGWFHRHTRKTSYPNRHVKSGATVFHYRDGATEDRKLEVKGKITKVSFCYGLKKDPPPPPPPPPPVDLVNLGPCDELPDNKLNKTQVHCPSNGQRAIISLSLEDKQDFASQFCTCNTEFATCNPNLNMGDRPDSDGEFKGLEACTGNQGINTRVPLDIMGVENPDSYICFTSGGRRICYGHF